MISQKSIEFNAKLSQWKDKQSLYHAQKSKKTVLKRIVYFFKKEVIRKSINISFLYWLKLKSLVNKKPIAIHHEYHSENIYLTEVHDSDKTNNRETLAIVLHIFYYDIFISIIEYIEQIDIEYKLYITTHPDIYSDIFLKIQEKNISAKVVICENKGRDILPFLKSLKLVKQQGHAVLLKLHTKRSPHRLGRGNTWRNNMLKSLLEPEVIKSIIHNFKNYPIGIVGPSKYLYPIWRKGNTNKAKIQQLANKISFRDNINEELFVGGTMFYARVDALEPISQLKLSDQDFQDEPIALDGSMAHALERFFGIACHKQGYEIVDTEFLKELNR